MVDGKGMHGSGDGKHRFVLETGVQRFGIPPQDHFGQSGASEGAERQKDPSHRQPMAGKFAAARIGTREFHSAARHSRTPGSDASATPVGWGWSRRTQTLPDDFATHTTP